MTKAGFLFCLFGGSSPKKLHFSGENRNNSDKNAICFKRLSLFVLSAFSTFFLAMQKKFLQAIKMGKASKMLHIFYTSAAFPRYVVTNFANSLSFLPNVSERLDALHVSLDGFWQLSWLY